LTPVKSGAASCINPQRCQYGARKAERSPPRSSQARTLIAVTMRGDAESLADRPVAAPSIAADWVLSGPANQRQSPSTWREANAFRERADGFAEPVERVARDTRRFRADSR